VIAARLYPQTGRLTKRTSPSIRLRSERIADRLYPQPEGVAAIPHHVPTDAHLAIVFAGLAANHWIRH
jgi:hypothetical protein